MSSRDDALITPSVMEWARRQAHLEPEAAACAIGRPEMEILAWEKGEKFPSIAQLREASRVYKRSLAVFFLPEPPKDFSTLRDFRSLPEQEREYTPELAYLVRNIYVRQQWICELLKADGEEALPFVGSGSTNSNIKNLAKTIRETLGVNTDLIRDCRNHSEALSVWIKKAEQCGIFVCRQGSVDLKEARGLVLTDVLAPFIYINNSDSYAGQIFTLLHEIAHIWINQQGISNLANFDDNNSDPDQQIERFCNKVAANVLVDDLEFRRRWAETKDDFKARIEKVSHFFRVSEEFIARRLFENRAITWDDYLALRKEFQARWEILKKTKTSRGMFYNTLIARNGRTFTRVVLNSYNAGRVSGRDASMLLGTKINHFQRLTVEAGGTSYRIRGVE